MKYRLLSSSIVAVAILAVFGLASTPAAQNGTPGGKPTCIGCSADGKTTPRTPDGHPDLNGFWDDQDGGDVDLGVRFADGSVLFDLAGRLGTNPIRRRPARTTSGAADSAPTLNPSYKPEYWPRSKPSPITIYGARRRSTHSWIARRSGFHGACSVARAGSMAHFRSFKLLK